MSVPAETHQHAQPLVRPLGPRRLLPLAIVVAGLIVFFVLGLNRELSLESLVRHHAAIERVVAEHRGPAFAAYVQAQPPEELFTASLCEAEIRYGIARLPAGRRRDALEAAFRSFIMTGFAGRILAFDSACAEAYATVRIRREGAGLPVSLPDAMIAGTALAHGATVATRNIGDFAGCGITVIDLWQPAD